MILLSSNLASSLHHWEMAEYVAEGFVILGCAGELVALIRRIPRRCREQIETWSTVVLVIALGIGLKCLMKTNELSTMEIGSLGKAAEQADEKARHAIADSNTALSQSKDALGKASEAEDSLGKAESEAEGAQTASANALAAATTAQGAVNSVAEKAEQLHKEVIAIGPRSISPDDQEIIVKTLRIGFFRHPPISVGSYGLDGEGAGLATQIMSIITSATGVMPVDSRAGSLVSGGFEMGVSIRGPESERPFMLALQYELTMIGKLDHVSVNGLKPSTGATMSGGASMAGGASMSGGGGPARQPPIPTTGPISIFVGIKPPPAVAGSGR